MSEFPSNVTPLAVGTDRPTITAEEILDYMHYSIHRFQNEDVPVSIPLVEPLQLEADNQRVAKDYGDEARKLLVIGPSVLSFEGNSGCILNRQAANLLGILIAKRELLTMDEYQEQGFAAKAANRASFLEICRSTFEVIQSVGVDNNGEPLLTIGTKLGQLAVGIPDVIVKDIRHSPKYKETFLKLPVSYTVKSYLEHGGSLPKIEDNNDANKLLSELSGVDKDKLSPEGQDRLRVLSLLLIPESDMAARLRAGGLLQQTTDELRARRSFIAKHFSEEAWADQAFCRPDNTKGIRADDFYQRPGERLRDFKERKKQLVEMFCANCVVKSECAEYAIRTHQTEGIWGGLDTVELGITKRRKRH